MKIVIDPVIWVYLAGVTEQLRFILTLIGSLILGSQVAGSLLGEGNSIKGDVAGILFLIMGALAPSKETVLQIISYRFL